MRIFGGMASSRIPLFIAMAMLLLAVVALVQFGYVGTGRGGGLFSFDSRYFYVSGEMWETGATPYDPAVFKDEMARIANIQSVSYAYPPNSAPFSLALSVGSLGLSQIIIGTINLAAILGIVAFAHGAIRLDAARDTVPPGDIRAAEIATWAVIIGNPFTAHVVWMGQTTLFSAAFLLGAWLLACKRLDVLAGIFLGISAVKPQLALLVGFWFLLDRRWQIIVASALTVVAMSAWPLWMNGLNGSWLAWMRSVTDYKDGAYNTLVFKHVFGVRSLLAAQDIVIPSTLPLAAVGTALLYFFRRHYQTVWLIGPLLILSVLLVYAHDYDLAPLAIMTFPLLIAARGRPMVLVSIILLAMVIYFPQRIWERLDMAELARSREVALLLLLALYLGVCRVAQRERRLGALS